MPINISTSIFGLQNKSTKDLIVSVLANEWPLSIKEIYDKLQKNYSVNASYQAVHKSILELENERIVIRQGKKYCLDKKWITNLRDFALDLEKKYTHSGKYEIDPNFKGSFKMKFDDFSVFSLSMAEIFYKQSLKGNGPAILSGVLKHAWWPLRFSFMDFHLLVKAIRKTESSWTLIKSDSPFDKWLVKQYVRAGFNAAITNVKIEGYDTEKDIGVYGDSIMEVEFSEETRAMLDEVYNKISSMSDLFKLYGKNAFAEQKADITIKFTKNPEIANVLREQMINYCKKYKK